MIGPCQKLPDCTTAFAEHQTQPHSLFLQTSSSKKVGAAYLSVHGADERRLSSRYLTRLCCI